MKNIEFVDLLFDRISVADSHKTLVYLEDDLNIAVGLGQIPDKKEIRFLKLAIQSRMSYVIFKEMLGQLESLLDEDVKPKLTLVKDFESKTRKK